MELKKNRKKIVAILVLTAIFIIVEAGCLIGGNYGRIRAVLQDKKGQYQSYEFTDSLNYELVDCVDNGTYLEVTGDNPAIILSGVSGYIDIIRIAANPSTTYCKSVIVSCDTGNGFQEENGIEQFPGDTEMEYVIRQKVQGIKISFYEIHDNPAGVPILDLKRVSVNPVAAGQYEEEISDYLLCTMAVAAFTYLLLIAVISKSGISAGGCILLAAFIVVLRLQSVNGYVSNIPHTAKILSILFGCAVTGFMILLIVRKSTKYEKNED